MEKIKYFLKEGTDTCKHLCRFMNNEETDVPVYIGSHWCGNECLHSFGYNYEKQWVKCEIYSAFAEVEKLKKENDKLKKQVEHLEKQISKGNA